VDSASAASIGEIQREVLPVIRQQAEAFDERLGDLAFTERRLDSSPLGIGDEKYISGDWSYPGTLEPEGQTMPERNSSEIPLRQVQDHSS
jgi:hypothetical protein